MPAPDYDLEALLWEVRQAERDAGAAGRDLARFSDLVLDRLGCSTGAEAFDRLYADWRELPRGTTPSGLRAGQILSLLPLLRLDQPVADRQREEELWREATEHGPPDGRWQAEVVARNHSFETQHITDPAEMEAALRRIERTRDLEPPGSPVRRLLDVTHAQLRAQLAQFGGGHDEYDAAVEELARAIEAAPLDDEQGAVLATLLAVYRLHQAIRREDEAALAEQIQVLDTALARFPDDHMDRLEFESHLEAARSALTVLRGRRTGRFDPVASPAPTGVPVHEVRREIAALPRNVRAHRLGEAASSHATRALVAGDYPALLEATELYEDALDLLEPDDDRWIRATGRLGALHCAVADLQIAPPERRAQHLDQGIAWLRHTWRLTGGPHHPLWGGTGVTLARAYRIRGDLHTGDPRTRRLNHDEARRIGIASVRAAAWSVLLQTGTAHAAQTARIGGRAGTGRRPLVPGRRRPHRRRTGPRSGTRTRPARGDHGGHRARPAHRARADRPRGRVAGRRGDRSRPRRGGAAERLDDRPRADQQTAPPRPGGARRVPAPAAAAGRPLTRGDRGGAARDGRDGAGLPGARRGAGPRPVRPARQPRCRTRRHLRRHGAHPRPAPALP
ncbi:hypothetical protein GCM10027074_76720 [Streptomyces deserti]